MHPFLEGFLDDLLDHDVFEMAGLEVELPAALMQRLKNLETVTEYSPQCTDKMLRYALLRSHWVPSKTITLPLGHPGAQARDLPQLLEVLNRHDEEQALTAEGRLAESEMIGEQPLGKRDLRTQVSILRLQQEFCAMVADTHKTLVGLRATGRAFHSLLPHAGLGLDHRVEAATDLLEIAENDRLHRQVPGSDASPQELQDGEAERHGDAAR